MEELSDEKMVKRIEEISTRMARECEGSASGFFGFVECLTAVEQKMKNLAYLPFYLEQAHQQCLAGGGAQKACEAATHERKRQALREAYAAFKDYDTPLSPQ